MVDLEVLGCLGTALVELLGGEVDFKVVSGFEVDLEVKFTLVLMNVKGLGGWGAGGLKGPIDSNRSFAVSDVEFKDIFSCMRNFVTHAIF